MLAKKKINRHALKIIRTLKSHGYQAYLVGGCVRDLLLGKTPAEWDLTTNALPKEVAKLFKKVVPTGIKYGTVTVILNGEKFEVTTFRKDEKYADGRHPLNVKFTQLLTDDLLRRDFTINAMAYDPISSELVDLFSGAADLKAELIRAVASPVSRFLEDGLRPVRACRFAAQLGFAIEKKTLSAIPKTLRVVKKVAIERVHDELIKMLKAEKPSVALDYMRKSGILKIFIPELVKLRGVKQPNAYHKYDVYWHSLYSCDAAPRDNLIVRLAALLHDIAKPKCKKGDTFYDHDQVGYVATLKILKRLRFSNEITTKVSALVANHMFNYESSWTDAAVRRFMRRVGQENLGDLFALRVADVKAMVGRVGHKYLDELKRRIKKIVAQENALHVSGLKINGRDVMRALNIPPGPEVGAALNALLEKVLDRPALNTREKLLELVRARKK
jgi:poly(A) polymerase/tRNA nucleotidyltransferase (CCA-adding enzyme)